MLRIYSNINTGSIAKNLSANQGRRIVMADVRKFVTELIDLEENYLEEDSEPVNIGFEEVPKERKCFEVGIDKSDCWWPNQE